MRKRKKNIRLGGGVAKRKALLKNTINSLILRGAIKTTEARAKAVRGIVDRLVSSAKVGTVQARRQLMAFLGDKKAVGKLVDKLAPKFERVSGFTRVVRLGRRKGDRAWMARLEFVKMREMVEETKKAKKKTQGPSWLSRGKAEGGERGKEEREKVEKGDGDVKDKGKGD